jgi:HPt (histidine-containing phosphotransfer) domain-containing protein
MKRCESIEQELDRLMLNTEVPIPADRKPGVIAAFAELSRHVSTLQQAPRGISEQAGSSDDEALPRRP